MSWKEIYQERLTTAQEALLKIKDNQRVAVGHACAEPGYLVDEMVSMKEHFHNIEIVHMVAMGKSEYCQPGMEEHFHHNAIFVGGSTRKAVAEGRADFTPVYFPKCRSFLKRRCPWMQR